MDDNALTRLFMNAQKLLLKNSENLDAKTVVEAIKIEWSKRLSLFQDGKYKAASPTHGVLSAVGYKVGNEGEIPALRRKLLDYIMMDTLPPVGSPPYMAEWGDKLSKVRYRKLHRVIRVLASGAKTLGNMEKAENDWEDDLVYIETHWADRVNN